MPDVAADIRKMLAGSLHGSVTLASGVTIRCDPSTASADDAFGGDGIIAGQTLVLAVATEDIPGVKARSLVTYKGQSYAVNHKQLRSQGNVTRLFLGAP